MKKAEEFYQTMLQAEKEKHWNAVGLNAVHCAISDCDAILVFHLGLRSSSEYHEDAVSLLSSLENISDAGQKSQTLTNILAKKNLVEYEDRDFHENEARLLIKLTTRFFEWITNKKGVILSLQPLI
ncbi:MAG: hypothetical protein AB1633_08115 [Elusimicrobiota bacterium]